MVPEDHQSSNLPGRNPIEPNSASAPVSVVSGPVANLLAGGIIGPPVRPGLVGRVDKYDLLRPLGQGGMGVVFLARQSETGTFVAIKMPLRKFAEDPEFISRFLREARRLQEIKHPNLVPVLEVCELSHGAFFVMPHFDKGSLAQLIKPDVPLTSSVILELLIPVAEALRVIHAHGLTHRDVKPGNILLDSDGSVCLADFGLARTVLNDSLIRVGQDQCEGTPAYMSPQILKGEKEDTRCDIYAFGALIYEMLTGRAPYQGETTNLIRERVLAGSPKPIRELNAKADAGLVLVAEGAMAREQRDRYANMSDLAADLRRVSAGIAPIGPHGLAGPWRRPLFHLGGVIRRAHFWIVLAALALGVALVTWPRPGLRIVSHFARPEVRSWRWAQPARFESPPGNDLLVVSRGDLLPFTAAGQLVAEGRWTCKTPTSEEIGLSLVADLKGDGLDEALISWASGTNLGISVLNANGMELARFTAHGTPPSGENRSSTSLLRPVRFVPSADAWDHRPKLLAALDVNYGGDTYGLQRALCCYDYATQSNEWQYPIGPKIEDVQLIDVDGDGVKEIVCGTSAPGNGYRGLDPRDDDAHSGIFAFSGRGKLLWHTPLSGKYSVSHLLTGAVDSLGRPGLIAWVYTIEVYHATNGLYHTKLVHLDYNGNLDGPQYQPTACIESCLPVQLDKPGYTQFLCADCEGCLHLVNTNLTLDRKVSVYRPSRKRVGRLDRAELRIIKAGRFIPGGGIQVAVQCCDYFNDGFTNPGRLRDKSDNFWTERSEILLLDADLDIKSRYGSRGKTIREFKWVAKAADMDGDGLDEILLLDDDHVLVLKYR